MSLLSILTVALLCIWQVATVTSFSSPVATPGTSPKLLESTSSESLVSSFSHVHFYVDHVQDVSVYKQLEDKLNDFASKTTAEHSQQPKNLETLRQVWSTFNTEETNTNQQSSPFVTQNRDLVQQLLAGLGFRVTGCRMPSDDSTMSTNTRSVLVTSKDPSGVQFVISSIDENSSVEKDPLLHFDAGSIRRFYQQHAHRQGAAVLAFRAKSVDAIEERYRQAHPDLILCKQTIPDVGKVLEVFAYYQGECQGSEPDVGTVLRFIEPFSEEDNTGNDNVCILPGLTPLEATFESSSQPAFCDHWVSNVVSRTGFLKTLEDTLGFTPKADFNAGVVAAGEAQIESTVTGNEADFVTTDQEKALRDQSQVYLPINNALSEVGHVNGFLREIGQGVQHIASRVDNLTDFVQRANDYREITGEGFTFLNIPRSYYGTLSRTDLLCEKGGSNSVGKGVSLDCAKAIVAACEKNDIVSLEGAVRLDCTGDDVNSILESSLKIEALEEYHTKKDFVLETILRSRYINLYSLLQDRLSEEAYLGLVRNKILVDVQGEDLLYQIFTSNILQRESGEESPFLEFIQRVCSSSSDEAGCPAQLKPGCGGFGIRNFLTLFLSIEVSKAMMDSKTAETEERRMYAQEMVKCFTDQLNESNPILTEISDAMTEEGRCNEKLQTASEKDALNWREKLRQASEAKQVGNQKLMECSTKYKTLMRSIRESWSEAV